MRANGGRGRGNQTFQSNRRRDTRTSSAQQKESEQNANKISFVDAECQRMLMESKMECEKMRLQTKALGDILLQQAKQKMEEADHKIKEASEILDGGFHHVAMFSATVYSF